MVHAPILNLRHTWSSECCCLFPTSWSIRVRGDFVDGSTASEVLLIIYSLTNDSNVQYITKQKEQESVSMITNASCLVSFNFLMWYADIWCEGEWLIWNSVQCVCVCIGKSTTISKSSSFTKDCSCYCWKQPRFENSVNIRNWMIHDVVWDFNFKRPDYNQQL